MASNTNNRLAIKWVRDRAKSAYEKKDECFICETTKDLELHHLVSLTKLLERWAEKHGYDISTDAGILAVREEFIAAHPKEIFEWVYTLCNFHHVKLHGIYGKMPAQNSAPKQEKWLQTQKDKFNGVQTNSSGSFSNFY